MDIDDVAFVYQTRLPFAITLQSLPRLIARYHAAQIPTTFVDRKPQPPPLPSVSMHVDESSASLSVGVDRFDGDSIDGCIASFAVRVLEMERVAREEADGDSEQE